MQHFTTLLHIYARIATLASSGLQLGKNMKSGTKNAANKQPPSPSLLRVVTFHFGIFFSGQARLLPRVLIRQVKQSYKYLKSIKEG